MTKLQLLAFAITLGAAATTASAENQHLELFTDVVTFDKPVTEAQCLDKAKLALTAAGLTTSSDKHSWGGAKTNAKGTGWVVGIDCLQSFKLNGAYITVAYTGQDKADFTTGKVGFSKAMLQAFPGKSEMVK